MTKIFFLTSFVLLTSCTMNSLRISVTEPAIVDLDNALTKVGLLNRTQVKAEGSIFDKIDKIISLEGKKFDQEGVENTYLAIHNQMIENPTFGRIVDVVPDSSFYSTNLGFPAPLPWERVDSICLSDSIELLFELSFYDTETNVRLNTVPVPVSKDLKIGVPNIQSEINIRTKIIVGWRIYDFVNKQIVDEVEVFDSFELRGRGVTPIMAVNAIKDRKRIQLQRSYDLGIALMNRLFPTKFRVGRRYYVKGTLGMKMAKRRARVGDWEGAAELWEKDTHHRRRKIAGRASYNMAIINEIRGDYDKAIEWASKSYVDYRNKEAFRYLQILKRRKAELAILKFQEEN